MDRSLDNLEQAVEGTGGVGHRRPAGGRGRCRIRSATVAPRYSRASRDWRSRCSEKARDTRASKLGPDHPDTLATLNDLAAAYQDAGKLPEAIALFERVRDARIAKLGPDHPDTLTTLNNLALAYQAAGKLAEAIAAATSASATPRSPSSAPTTPTPWPRSTTSPWRTRPPASSPRRSPCSSASATPRSPSSAPTTPTP